MVQSIHFHSMRLKQCFLIRKNIYRDIYNIDYDGLPFKNARPLFDPGYKRLYFTSVDFFTDRPVAKD